MQNLLRNFLKFQNLKLFQKTCFSSKQHFNSEGFVKCLKPSVCIRKSWFSQSQTKQSSDFVPEWILQVLHSQQLQIVLFFKLDSWILQKFNCLSIQAFQSNANHWDLKSYQKPIFYNSRRREMQSNCIL